MTNLAEKNQWEVGVYQIEQTDPVVGGPPDLAQGQGITNVPHQALANRTAWLKDQVEALQQALTDLTNGAPGAMDTLNELAAALGDDENFAATMTAALAGKLSIADAGSYLQDVLPHYPEDIDILTQSGNYHVGTGAIGSIGEGRLLHLRRNDNEWSQIVIVGHNGMYFRDKDNSASPVGPWRRVATEGDEDAVIPPGLISMWSTAAPPSKWLECDGAEISRTSYDALFAAIGTDYGVGDGASTFNLPDLRGEFVRGWDNGRGVDVGRLIGSYQADELRAHTHTKRTWRSTGFDNTGGSNPVGADANGSLGSRYTITESTGGPETRPRNIAQMFCIKY